MRTFVVLAALFGAACSNKPFVATQHTALPQIDKHAGIVIDAPELVTITFPGYEFATQANALADFIGGSSWLTAVGAEYGVGAGTSKAKVTWPSAAPASATDQDVITMLQTGIMNGTLPAPSGSKNELVYVVYWPTASVLDVQSQGKVMCMRGSAHNAGDPFLLGYHDSFMAPDGTLAPFAIIGDCGDGVSEVTSTASREMIGSFTNPYEVNNTGWLLDVARPDPWYLNIDNGEVGYMCEREKLVEEGGFALHRSWSNAAAAASNQPCVPSPEGDAYYNVTASPDTLTTVAAGATATFQITGWSNQSVSSWHMLLTQPDGSEFTLSDLSPTLDDYTGANGKTTTLTIHVPSTAFKQQVGGVNVMSGDSQHAWPVGFIVQ